MLLSTEMQVSIVVPSTTWDLLSCDFQNESKVVPDIIYQIGESFLWHAQEKED